MTAATTPPIGSSISPLTGRRFRLPVDLDDRENIERFVDRHAKPVVAVQGLGFVGAVMSLVVANAHGEDYAVIGVDLPNDSSYWRIGSINGGDFPVAAIDPKIPQYWKKAQGKLLATHDPYAFGKADVIIVDINLDVQKHSTDDNLLKGFDVNMKPFEAAIKTIGQHCRADVLIVVETTVPPGTCEKIVRPLIEACFTQRELPIDQFRLGHSYERVMPGAAYIDSIENFYRVYSGINEESADATETFLKTVIRTDEYPLTRLASTTATEMAKVLENSFRATNIAFIVEWSRFAEEAGVNLFEVVQAIRMRPTHRNIMLPGLGVGGYCLTKDPLLASWARQTLFDSESLCTSENGVRVNDQMPLAAFEFLSARCDKPLDQAQVLLLGVSYLNDVADTRSTPVELFYDCLKQASAAVRLHDPYVKHWDEKQLVVEQSLDTAFDAELDYVVITTGHSDYRNNRRLLDLLLEQKDLVVLDTIGVLTNEEIATLRQRHTIHVLGRGDLERGAIESHNSKKAGE